MGIAAAEAEQAAAFGRLIDKLSGAAVGLRSEDRDALFAAVLDQLEPGDRIRVENRDREILSLTELELVEDLDAREVQMAPLAGGLTLIVKGTRLCNLRCVYCNDWRSGPGQTMSFRVLAHTVWKALRHSHPSVVDFVWHGGETTLLPRRFYEQALYLQSRFRLPGQLVRNEIQTNGTRLDARWAAFFARNEFSVGISLDGPPAIHDRYRRYVTGHGSFADVMEGVATLREQGLEPSVLMVIDEEAYSLGPRAIFEFFLRAGLRRFGLLAVKPTNQPDAASGTSVGHYVDPPRFNAFLAALYDIWLEHGDPTIQVRELDVLRRRIAGTRHRPCTLTGGCLGQYFLVEPDGQVAHCDLFLGDEEYSLGNVLTSDFASMARDPKMTALKASNDAALDAMRSCPTFNICNGWCPHERYTSVRHNKAHREDCCGLHDLIVHLQGHSADLQPDVVQLNLADPRQRHQERV